MCGLWQDTCTNNATSQPAEATTTQPANETDKKVEPAQSGETAATDRSVETSSETSDNVTPSQGGKFTSDEQGNWYYLDSEGHKLTGPQTIDSFNLYFHDNGIQAKGEKVTIDGKDYYYDKDNGRKVTDTSIEVDGKTYLADADGILTEKTQLPPRSWPVVISNLTTKKIGITTLLMVRNWLVGKMLMVSSFILIKKVNKSKDKNKKSTASTTILPIIMVP